MGQRIKLLRAVRGFVSYTPRRALLLIYTLAIVGGLLWTVAERETQQRALVAEVGEGQQEIARLKGDDQTLKNASLESEIASIQTSYEKGAELFTSRAEIGNNKTVDLELAKFLRLLGEREWSEADRQAEAVRGAIDKAIAASIPKVSSAPITSSNSLPANGYSRQRVATTMGEFVVSLVSAPAARAVVETASEADCRDNCPTKTLAEHVASAGGFAGINGAYFCPPDYPQCQGKSNSFDTLAVNGRTKAVLNRENNVYSTIPLVAMYGGNLSFYDQTVQWGVDTTQGGALANYPRLLRDGNVATTEQNGRGTRGFIGVKDGVIVIGHIYAASFGEAAEVLKTLGLQNAMNLDGGGSSALYFEGSYKVGPGRSLPSAIVLVR